MTRPLIKKELFKIGMHLLLLAISFSSTNAQGCDFLENDVIQLNIANQNIDGAYTQQYALTSTTGFILDIESLPSFPAQTAGNYIVYALNYETSSGISGFSIGNNIAAIGGSCFDTTSLVVNVCVSSADCHSTDGTVVLSIAGANTGTGFTQSYALVDTNGIIQRIKDNPSTTQPLFVAISAGDYQVYALNYETASGVNDYLVGNAINGVTGTCLDLAQPINYRVCPCPFTGCNSSDSVISFNVNGHNQTATFTQAYALTDTFGLILQTSIAPNNTDSLFEGIPTGYYHIYAINYETASGIMGLSAGNNIADVLGACFNITGAFCYQVCNDNYDFGDLPDNSASTAQGDYQTLLANDGPRHLIIAGLSLGDSIDMEVDGIPDISAEGDGTDDDGVIFFSSLDIVPNMNFRLPLNYINTTGDTAFIEGWIDWNGDGDFDEANEFVLAVNDGNGTTPIPNRWEISIPADAITDTPIGVRLRISLQDNMTPYGTQPNGEVEDYLLYLKCPKICLPITVELKRG